jgi:hypothetical protein
MHGILDLGFFLPQFILYLLVDVNLVSLLRAVLFFNSKIQLSTLK